MLRHKKLQTTQYYTKFLDRKVSDDMKILKDKFNVNAITPKKVSVQ